jgi:putative endonuclease
MNKSYYVYILTNKSLTLYIGSTSDLAKRIKEHKDKVVEGFTKRYNIDTLVYVESYETEYDARYREKQLKKWSRRKKLDLIASQNPKFEDITKTLII